MESLKYSFKGCRHCVSCYKLTQCSYTDGAPEMWPAGLQSPTVYFMLRERQLAYNIKAVAAHGPAAWRANSVAAGAPNELLQRRGLPQLSLKLPLTAGYGVQYGETAVFVRTIQPAAAIKAPAAAAAQAALKPHFLAAAPTSLSTALPSASIIRLDTPPQQREQPAKRTRTAAAAAAGAPAGLPPRPVTRAARSATPSPGHFIAAAAPALGTLCSPVSVVIPMTGRSSFSGGSSCSSMSVSPASSGSSSSALSAVAAAATSPLLSLFQMVKGLVSPAPQQLMAY